MTQKITYRFGKSELNVEFGDIVTSEAQVIVSSDDCYLSMGGGVSAAIRRAGGEGIALDAAKKIPAELGTVVVTTAGKLPAHYVFHVITRSPPKSAPLPDDALQKATERCLQLMDVLGVNSIAFPALGAGYVGVQLDKVAAQMARAIAATLLKCERQLEVSIYLFDDRGLMSEMDFIPFIARFAARVPDFDDHKTDTRDSSVEAESTRNQVFISYSHKNKDWLDRLQTMLTPLVRKNALGIWDDQQIEAGSKWRDEITKALSSAKVAVLLVSPEFLGSDFIYKHELPPLLAAAQHKGLVVLWVCLSACLYQETEIEAYQAAHDVGKPLDSLAPHEQNAALVRICQEIKKAAVNTL
jgi:O-acetyl-ADP-ribose deacetylase (regulator of RNase III)